VINAIKFAIEEIEASDQYFDHTGSISASDLRREAALTGGRHLSDARTAEDGPAPSRCVNESAKVVLEFRAPYQYIPSPIP
jgi:hypothetical protein